MSEIQITNENFEKEVLQADRPVLLDFWAEWCGPCRMLAPVVGEIAEEYADSVKVGKVNVDEEPELAAAFRVSAIPMLAVMRDGALLRTSAGFRPKQDVLAMLQLQEREEV